MHARTTIQPLLPLPYTHPLYHYYPDSIHTITVTPAITHPPPPPLHQYFHSLFIHHHLITATAKSQTITPYFYPNHIHTTPPSQHYCPYQIHTPPRHHHHYVANCPHSITAPTCTITTTTHNTTLPPLLPQSHTCQLHATPFQLSLTPNLLPPRRHSLPDHHVTTNSNTATATAITNWPLAISFPPQQQ